MDPLFLYWYWSRCFGTFSRLAANWSGLSCAISGTCWIWVGKIADVLGRFHISLGGFLVWNGAVAVQDWYWWWDTFCSDPVDAVEGCGRHWRQTLLVSEFRGQLIPTYLKLLCYLTRCLVDDLICSYGMDLYGILSVTVKIQHLKLGWRHDKMSSLYPVVYKGNKLAKIWIVTTMQRFTGFELKMKLVRVTCWLRG